ncbi:hypothetical protein [Clostridium sp. DJ247]|uniref:hypothetical protein n=1 Tax=Clostridium sp. DJ247 TaxID=2726188 RepID=UPI001624A15F|nr:hypothetical protein [Clostridium sp. DJ247]MBC2581390.1 hypothetical protein [Clostridium sp. DJ247]
MALMYYAKLNVNSHIFEVYEKKLRLKDILFNLAKSLNDETEYINKNTYTKNGELKVNEEIYNFADLKEYRDNVEHYITGNIVRRFPYFTERFNEKTRKFTREVISNNSTSIFFYFDIKTEIITFCNRRNFKQIQFINAFQNLVNLCYKDIGFQVFIISDPFSISERLSKVKKVTRIKATIIPPNVNEEHFKELYDEEVSTLHESHIGKKTTIFEHDIKGSKGININSKMVQKTINANEAFKTFEKGYGRLEVEGVLTDGTKYHFTSDDDSPYMTLIDENLKDSIDEFIKESKNGIKRYIARLLNKKNK